MPPDQTDRLLARLTETARLRDYPDDPVVLRQLLAWLEVVLELGRRVNLTAAKDLDQAVDVLALSALAVTRAVEQEPVRVVDLGTGNGLPGVAAALAWPDAEVILVERRGRKAAAVAEGVARLRLSNTSVLTCDGREVLGHRPDLEGAVDLVTVRAVGTLADVARIAAPWLAPGGRIAHWKGRSLSSDETEDGRRAARQLGLKGAGRLVFDDPAGPGYLVLYERPE